MVFFLMHIERTVVDCRGAVDEAFSIDWGYEVRCDLVVALSLVETVDDVVLDLDERIEHSVDCFDFDFDFGVEG